MRALLLTCAGGLMLLLLLLPLTFDPPLGPPRIRPFAAGGTTCDELLRIFGRAYSGREVRREPCVQGNPLESDGAEGVHLRKEIAQTAEPLDWFVVLLPTWPHGGDSTQSGPAAERRYLTILGRQENTILSWPTERSHVLHGHLRPFLWLSDNRFLFLLAPFLDVLLDGLFATPESLFGQHWWPITATLLASITLIIYFRPGWRYRK